MDKLKMQSENLVDENVEFIGKKFPNCIVEGKNDNGEVVKMVDFDLLKQELSKVFVEGNQERYVMSWPDKRQAIISANMPLDKALRPCKKESVDFENTQNIYIEGDNLESLKILREAYLNKIKLIYIDPPYNAGADLLYKNNYEINEEEFKTLNNDINEDGFIMTLNSDTSGRYHTDWLNMMYSRIKVAKDMLSEDGCMVIAIDHNELANTIKITDEIFSEKNRIGIVTVVHKPEGRNQEKYFASSNEFALFYAKNLEEFNFEKVIIDEEIYKKYDLCDDKGKYTLISFIAKNHGREGFDKNLRINSPHKYFPIYVSKDLKQFSLDKIDGYYEVYPNTGKQERTWKYIKTTCLEKIKNNEIVAQMDSNGKVQLYEKYREDKGQLIKTHWIDKKYNAMVNGTKLLDGLMGVKTFDFPKSLYLMEDIINLTTKKDSIILDFFSGSSTTAHATMLLNSKDGGKRKFIMIQLPLKCNKDSEAFKSGYETIPQIAKERIRRAGLKILLDYAKENIDNLSDSQRHLLNTIFESDDEIKFIYDNNLCEDVYEICKGFVDIGFRVLKLDSSNMKDVYYSPSDTEQTNLLDLVSNIKEDRSPEDLLFQVMLDMGVMLSSDIKTFDIKGKKVFNVNDGNLVCCFDENLTDEVVTEIAKMQPLYAVFRDSSMSSDSVAVNFDQIFETYSPSTTRKVL